MTPANDEKNFLDEKSLRNLRHQAGALFVGGYGIAMVDLIKRHGADAMARDVILAAGLSIEHFEAARMEPDDIAILKKALAQ